MPASLRRALPLAAAIATFLPALAAFGQESDAAEPPGPDPTAAEALAERHAALKRDLEALRAASAPDPATRESIATRLEVLESIDATLSRAIEQRRAIDDPPDPPLMPTGPGSASIATLDALEQERERAAARREDLEQAIEASREAGDAARDALREAESERRGAREARDAKPSVQTDARLALAQARSRAAQEEVHLRDLELRADRAERKSLEPRIAALEEQARGVVEALRTSSSAADAVDPALVAREGELARRKEDAERQLATAELRLRNASTRYASRDAPAPALVEEVETLQIARDAAAQTLAALGEQQQRLAAERELRERWLTLIRSTPPRETLSEWQEAAAAAAEAHTRAILKRQGRLADLSARSDALARRLDAEALSPDVRSELEKRRGTLQAFHAALAADAEDIARQQGLQRRFLGLLEAESGRVPFADRLADLWSSISELWGYELTTIDDDPITVGNAILALFLIGLGFSLSRRLSLGLRNFLDRRLSLEPGIAGAVQTVVFYTLIVSFGLLALRSVNFPLTAFTFAGGALAIGIGFGSQNVMNNFISGLILMLERPVRANDLVEVENTHGIIEHIGARSTRIRATDGRHLIVPNSFFLENNVVNWTLSDDLIRTKVSVGVIYGSPTRRVEQLIRQVLDEHPRVLPDPEPIIIFAEFGDNSLNFEAHFWTRARGPMAVNRLSGELRFRIDDLFREHELVIAFPQRDVHLDSVSPIEVRLTDDANPPRSRPAPDADAMPDRLPEGPHDR